MWQIEVTFQDPVPDSLTLGFWGMYSVRIYHSGPLRGFKCQAFGHIQKHCMSTELRWVQPVTPQLQVCKPSEGWLPWNTDSWIQCHKMFAPMYHTHTVSSCDIEGYPFLALATCRDVNYNLISYFVDNSNLSNYLLNKIWGNINVIV